MLDLIIKWVLYAFVIVFVAWVMPGISVEGFMGAMFVAVILGLINILIKPVLQLITLPINVLTLGLFGLILNAFLLILAGHIAPGFSVYGFWQAFFGAILISVFSAGIYKIGEN